MKAVRNKVLVEQTYTKVVKSIHLLNEDKDTGDTNKWTMESKLLQLGAEVETTEIKEGDKILLSPYASCLASKEVSSEDGIKVRHEVYDYTDIVAIS